MQRSRLWKETSDLCCSHFYMALPNYRYTSTPSGFFRENCLQKSHEFHTNHITNWTLHCDNYFMAASCTCYLWQNRKNGPPVCCLIEFWYDSFCKIIAKYDTPWRTGLLALFVCTLPAEMFGGVPVLWSKSSLASSLLQAIKTCHQACPPGYLLHFS